MATNNPPLEKEKMNLERINADQGFIHYITGTHYPYLEMGGGFSRAVSSFKRLIAPINPFAVKQGFSAEGEGFTPNYNSKWYLPPQLPSDLAKGRVHPVHVDGQGATDEDFPDRHLAQKQTHSGIIKMGYELYPLVCYRFLDKYDRCKLFNGKEKCREEEAAFLETCPNPVLQEMRKEKISNTKHRMIQLADYKRAMTVSEYNKGRSVADVDPNKRFIDGTSERLRPDSMWADERYANVTQEEIEAAREKIGEKQNRIRLRTEAKIQPLPKRDPTKQNYYQEMPIYSK